MSSNNALITAIGIILIMIKKSHKSINILYLKLQPIKKRTLHIQNVRCTTRFKYGHSGLGGHVGQYSSGIIFYPRHR